MIDQRSIDQARDSLTIHLPKSIWSKKIILKVQTQISYQIIELLRPVWISSPINLKTYLIFIIKLHILSRPSTNLIAYPAIKTSFLLARNWMPRPHYLEASILYSMLEGVNCYLHESHKNFQKYCSSLDTKILDHICILHDAPMAGIFWCGAILTRW